MRTAASQQVAGMKSVLRPSWRCGLSCALLLLASASGLYAQNPAAQDIRGSQLLPGQSGNQLDQNASANGEDQGYAAVSPNDSDLGQQQILKRGEEYQPFTLSIHAPFFYTSNVALVRRDAVGDTLIAPEIGVTYAPKITQTLYGEFSVRQQFFLYNRYDDLNFSSFDASAGLIYQLPKVHNLILRARYNYNRLTDIDHFDEFFANHSLTFNAELPFRIGRAQQISIGADANVSLYANPDLPQRDDYQFYVGYSVHLSRSFSIDAVGRIAIRDYRETDRVDISEIAALSANYRIRDWLTLSAISTFAANQSNHNVFDYQVFNIGGGVALTIKF
jgi:hypothetical protein